MTGPPAARPEHQARGGQPRSNPRWVRTVNPVLNQSPTLRRKDAERLVRLGRAEWVASDQIRLVMSDPQNRAAAALAAGTYNAVHSLFPWHPGISSGATVMCARPVNRKPAD